jgi:glucokinase
MTTYVGIDIGATRVKAGLVNEHNAITREHSVWLHEYEKTPKAILEILSNIVDAVLKRSRPELVGVGVPGVIDRKKGVVRRSPNYPEFENFEIRERLSLILGCPVIVDNDANCVVAGEYLAGVAEGRENLIGMTLGTGVGGAIILEGKLWRGVNGMAGEFGHVIAEPNGQFCKGSGVRGPLEMYPSLVGLREMCRTYPVPGVDPENPDLPKLLADAATAGDRTALLHFQTAGKCLGRVLGGLLNIFDVKTIVISGGISAAYPLMERATLEALTQVVYPEILEGAQILLGNMGDKAGILGAAMNWKLDGGVGETL